MLCSGIVAIVKEKCPELSQEAKDIYKRFTGVLPQYAKCHNVFNRGVVDSVTIDQLGTEKVHSLKLLYFRARHSNFHGALQGGVSHRNNPPHFRRPCGAMDAAVANGGRVNGRTRSGEHPCTHFKTVSRHSQSTRETSLHRTGVQYRVCTRAEQLAPCST